MTAPYIHSEMPPVIRRDQYDHYRLEGQSGVVIAEFEQTAMSHPGGWWSELVDAMQANYDNPADAIHDSRCYLFVRTGCTSTTLNRRVY